MTAREYKAGQRWKYRIPDDKGFDTLVVGHVEQITPGLWAVHISVENPAFPIAHMPFSPAALDASVLELVDEGVPALADFQAGYDQWKEARGGVFTITVADAVAGVVRSAAAPDFDSLVREMRAARSDAMIEMLYATLFRIPFWFFVGDPLDSRRPVQWVFPEGHNPNPCLLAFTDRTKAEAAVRELNLGDSSQPAKIIQAPVHEAIAWMLGGPRQEGIDWVSFNCGSQSENFPLYFDMAEAALRQMT